MTFHRRMLSVLALLATSFSMPSHAETQQEIVAKNIGKELDPRQIVVTLERRQCMGSCPAYRIKIDGAGEVEYEGQALVKITGTRKTTIRQEEALHIVDELLRVRFFDAPAAYDDRRDSITSHNGRLTLGSGVITDQPSVFLGLQIGSDAKRVRLSYTAPKEVAAIADLIDQTVRIEQWIGIDCERPRSPMFGPRPAGECEP